MRKIFKSTVAIAVAGTVISTSAGAASHTVVKGDTMWKIASKYQVGVSEVINANPQIENFDLIYPGQVINIPAANANVQNYENEVIRLVNEIRVKTDSGLYRLIGSLAA